MLKKLYLRNGEGGGADWRKGTKGMWVDRMLDPVFDFELWRQPWPVIFKVNLWKKSLLRNGMPDWHGIKWMWVDWVLDPCRDFQLRPHAWPWPWIFNVKFWNSCIPGTGGSIDMERKGYESIGCYTYFVTLSYGFDLGFWRSNSKNSCIIGVREWINMEQNDVSW